MPPFEVFVDEAPACSDVDNPSARTEQIWKGDARAQLERIQYVWLDHS